MSATAEAGRRGGPGGASGPGGQASLRRMRQFEVRPDRELGQNFLVDSNILGVIAEAAGVGPDDVVLEVGGGLGVLSEYLAARVRHLHVVELDRRLEQPLGEAVGGLPNVTLHWGDAMKLDLAGLQPSPVALVANLPYGIATALLLRTIDQLASLDRWLVMVQREVGERLAAAPAGAGRRPRAGGARVYGASSVLVQLACRVEVVRAIPRTVFHPVPNVDSVLVALSRVAPPPSRELRELVHGAFAHRRKSLARSLWLASEVGAEAEGAHEGAGSSAEGSGGSPRSHMYPRDQVQAVLVDLGHPPDVRAERLSPRDFQALARALGVPL